jgi:glycerol-3-phosphate acyltransferase PlsY
MLMIFISIIIGYLLGSIPTAYIAVRIIKRADIRDIDVGNVGAAAAIRQIGVIPGLIVAFIDIGKGAASILVANALSIPEIWILCSGFAAFLGHCFPIYIGFKGGQGAATVIGIFLVLSPYVTLIMLGLIGIALLVLRRIFPSICIVAIFLPLLIFLFNYPLPVIIFSLLIMLFMILRNFKGISKEIKALFHFIRKKSGK